MVRPIKLKTAAPKRLQRFAPGEQIDRDTMPLVTTSEDGAMSADDKVILDGLPDSIADEEDARVAADAALQAQVDLAPRVDGERQTDVTESAGRVSVAHRAAGYVPPHAASRLPVRGWSANIDITAGATASPPPQDGPYFDFNDVSIDGSLRLVSSTNSFVTTPTGAHALSVGSELTMAGWPTNPGNNTTKTIATLAANLITFTDTTGLVAETINPSVDMISLTSYTQYAHPWAALCRYSFDGYPHYNLRRLEANLSNGNTPSYPLIGAEEGEFVGKGLLVGECGGARGVDYQFTAWLTNEDWEDACFEFRLEPNPTVRPALVQDGPYVMRMPSQEFADTWTGERQVDVRISFRVTGRTSCSWEAIYAMHDEAAVEGDPTEIVWSQIVRGATTNGFDWLANDAILGLWFGVFRIAELGTYPATSQGQNLQLRLSSARCVPVGGA